MLDQVSDLDLTQPIVKRQWEQFLNQIGIEDFSDAEVNRLTITIGIYIGDQLVATGSMMKSVLKYIGVAPNSQHASRFNLIVSTLINRSFQLQQTHLMVFTKPKYQASFEYVGFHTLLKTTQAALLELGTPNVQQYLTQIPRVPLQNQQRIAGIVMNANPFTRGHRYLVEQAAQQFDFVYVFVVTEEASLFTSTERIQLVQLGTSDLANVIVVPGGPYMVSYATFPAYFIATSRNKAQFQMTLDAELFRQIVAPTLSITTRVVGTETSSSTTAKYNQTLIKVLSPAISVMVIKRQTTKSSNQIISASQVRQQIKSNNLSDLREWVPPTTAQFIQKNLSMLQHRIEGK